MWKPGSRGGFYIDWCEDDDNLDFDAFLKKHATMETLWYETHYKRSCWCLDLFSFKSA